VTVGEATRRAPLAVRVVGPLGALRGLLDRPLASYYLLMATAALLLAIGLMMVFSATNVSAYAETHNAFAVIAKQATWALIGLVGFWACQRLPVRTYRFAGKPLLVVAFVLVSLVDLLDLANRARQAGRTQEVAPLHLGPVYAVKNWLHIGGFQLQPSELAKLALLLWGAQILVRKGTAIGNLRELAVPLFPVAGIMFALVGYNDLGTMLTMVTLFVTLLWVAGVRMRVFASMLGVMIGGVFLLMAAVAYRNTRIRVFLHPDQDLSGDGYQPRQGLIAVATGGWFGKGLGASRAKWGALPEQHNDFIYAIIAEELGVMGCLLVLALFAVLAYTGLRIARRVDDPFRPLAAAGGTVWLIGQAMINIGAVVHLLPVTGVPLPFISDGGSALVVALAAVGMLASFARAEPDAARAMHARPPAKLVRLLWAPLPPLPRAPARRTVPQRRPAADRAGTARGSSGGRAAGAGRGRGSGER